MATRSTDSPQDNEEEGKPRGTSSPPRCEANKQKDGRDQSDTSAAPSPGGGEGEEPFSWPGPKTLRLQRTSQGFGFTLRHFIVYPPESAVHSSLKDEDNGSRGRQRNRLEPMDTIFVKQVKEGGPAHGAGLCTGDRIVKVNGESIIGKTYSQVIALIQNSADSLELCVMPKDEDILQLFSRDITALAYSQDAYLKGNDAYSGNARNIPEPPPICYPRLEVKATGAAQAYEPTAATDPVQGSSSSKGGSGRRGGAVVEMAGYSAEIPVPPSPPNAPPQQQQASRTQAQVVRGACNDGTIRTAVAEATGDAVERGSRAARAGPSHRTEENRYAPPPAPPSPDAGRAGPLATTAPPSGSGEPQQYAPPLATADPPVFPSPSRPGPSSIYADTLSAPSVRASTSLAPAAGATVSPALSPAPSPSNACPRYSPLSASSTPSSTPLHQVIDWRNYTTYKDYVDARRPHSYGCRTIQERLDSLRAAAGGSGSAYSLQATPPPPSPSSSSERRPALSSQAPQARRRSASHDRCRTTATTAGCQPGAPLRSVSQERLGSGDGAAERGAGASAARNWPHRSASQDALLPSSFSSSSPAARVAAEPRARSCDYLGSLQPGDGSSSAVTSGDGRAGYDRIRAEDRLPPGRGGGGEEVRGASSLPAFTKGTTTDSASSRTTGALAGRPSRLPVKHSLSDVSPPASLAAADPLLLLRDQRAASPLTANHLGYPSPLQHLQLRARDDSLRLESWQREQQKQRAERAGLSARSASCSGGASLSSSRLQRQAHVGEAAEGADATAVVVLRRDKSSSGGALQPLPIRHPSYILAIHDHQQQHHESPEARSLSTPALLLTSASLAGEEEGGGWSPARRLGLDATRRHASDSNDLDGSLDSIPFIDEPSSSPSMDLDSTHIPASALICGTPIITTIPPSPTSPSALFRRQLSHDQDSLRLTITESDSGGKTERSKSYDEGLDNYREECRGRSLMPELKGLKGKAVDRSSEDSGSHQSSSDVFCDATKEGLLHFKQLSTDKSKRVVGGGMRPWKQMYAVLRGPSLCLYKDRREGQAHANGVQCPAAGGSDVTEPLPISIKACLVDISYSDTKRKNVLRLTTSDCEFLFQAEDREDMLAWIRVVQENSNLDEENADFTSRDLISKKIKEYNTLMSPTGSKAEPSPKPSRQSLSIRQTLLGGGNKAEPKTPSPQSPRAEQERKNMHKDDTSPPKDKGTWRKGISGRMRKPFERKPSPGVTFGVRLDDCPPAHNNRFVPLIVEVCCKLVEDRGLEYTGIYRVPGNNAAISNMQEELNNKGMNDIDVQDDKWRDLNVISSLLKSFFRKLPEPLFTNDKYADFIEANRIEDPVDRLKTIKRLLHELPDHHYETLKFLSAHLKTVADSSEKNKMEPRNLAIVFGPTLVRTSEDNMTHMVTHMPDQYKIVETLIQNYDWFFTEDGNGEPVTASRDESAVESQPVPNIDHLLTNIGRTGSTQGEVSDSPTSDSAKSKGSWGSGKDQFSRELLVSSIFAAASRKRKKSKEKPQPSSSDDDLDSVFPKKELPGQKPNRHLGPQAEAPSQTRSCPDAKEQARPAERKENGRAAELTPKTKKKEHRNSFFLREKTPSRQPSPASAPSPRPSGSPGLGYQTTPLGKSSLSDAPSQLDENTSDLGTMSSGASAPRSRPKKWMSGATAPDLSAAGAGASVVAEVSSITSDYSTTSSITFLTGAESSVLSPELQEGGEEADDERSELVSEGRPMETDSESDFPVFAPAGGSSQSTPGPGEQSHGGPPGAAGATEGSASPKMEPRRLFPSHRLMECDTLSRRRSLRQKTDSDSSVEGGLSGGGEGRAESSSTRLSRVLEVMRKGRSTGSLSSSSRSESERPAEPAWRLKITERLKFRLRASADDMFGAGGGGAQKGVAARASGKKKGIRRRHTMGGQRDFAELAVMNDWREQGGVDQTAELSAVDRLKPRCSSPDLSIRDWITRERCRGAECSVEEVAPKAIPEDDHQPEGKEEGATTPAPERPSPSASPGPPPPPQPVVGEHVNGSAPPQGRNNKASLSTDAHPHKLSGAQVVRSRFYQYL